MKLIKKTRPESTQVKYHVYDGVLDAPFAFRIGYVRGVTSLVTHTKSESKYLVYVQTDQVASKKELDKVHQKNLKDGYEGTILRHGTDPYKINARASQLLKYKDFIDIAAKIIDITPAEQRTEWGVPVCEFNGKTFRCNTKMSHEDKRDLLTNKDKYIGKTAEVRFFEYTDTGIPRFPVMVGIRLDK
jgi:DNA ligase-1